MTVPDSALFDLLDIDLAGCPERVLVGGRHLFPLLPRAFAGIERIGVIGWGPQGRAQALNLRDSLAGTGISVAVGLRAGSASFAAARTEHTHFRQIGAMARLRSEPMEFPAKLIHPEQNDQM